MQSYGVDKQVTPAKMQGMISFDKNHLPDQKPETSSPVPFFNEVRSAYEKEKSQSHAYDFDDLLVTTLNLLKTNPAVRTSWQETVRHLLVDEYQDTNQIQHALLKMFALDAHGKIAIDSICAVGDQDQSIYSWRGAQADNMHNFSQDFAPVSTVNIEQNYRSVQPILQAANEVIGHNVGRIDKKALVITRSQERIVSTYCQTGAQEAQLITQAVSLARQKTSLNDIAILYRTHHQSRLIEEGLIHCMAFPISLLVAFAFMSAKRSKICSPTCV